MSREAVGCRRIDLPPILPCGNIRIPDSPEKLLPPTQRPKELRREFVLRLQIIGQFVSVPDPWRLVSRFVNLRPDLPVVPRKAQLLAKNVFMIVPESMSRGQAALRFPAQIRATACGDAQVPSFVR